MQTSLWRLVLIGILGASWAGVAFGKDTSSTREPLSAPSNRLMYNSDGNHIFHDERRPADLRARWHSRGDALVEPLTVEKLLQHVDEVSGTGVGTFLLCPISYQVVLYKSAIERRLGDGATEEQLKGGSLSIRETIAALRNFDALGVDPFELLVKRIREKGMSPVVTWRLQQAHVIYGGEKSIAQSPFWEAHPECRLKGSGGGGEKDAALDFANPAVQARKVALIREFVVKYGMDGCQLDFQRFPLFFVKGKEAEEISLMNGFMRSMRKMLDEEGAKLNRHLTMGVRIPENPERCRALGLDPATWVNEGLVDSVVVSTFLFQNAEARFTIPHYPIDIPAFRALFKKPVPIYGAIQALYGVIDRRPVQFRLMPDDYRKEALKLWGQGADGIELFNMFMMRAKGAFKGTRAEPPFFLLKELGSPDLIGRVRSPEEAAWMKLYGGADSVPEPYRAQINTGTN